MEQIMSFRPKGRHVQIDVNFPEGLGICDYTGFVFNHKDLVKQMEWRGNGLIWTGYMVGRPYLDVPNEQLRPPILPPDPVPLRLPRPRQPEIIFWNLNPFPDWIQCTTYEFIWPNISGYQDGTAAESPQQRSQDLYNYNWGWQ
jgi:hypothetical protein